MGEHKHEHFLNTEDTHSHVHSHNHRHEHDHVHEDTLDSQHLHRNHSHTHDPDEVKAVINRLSRAIGHLESVRQMVIDGRDCTEVLTQLSAVRSALNNTGLLILQGHIEHCIVEAVQEGDYEAIKDLNTAIARYYK
jgi:DNA-binding FrmR family transcriptional regulator